MPKRACGLLWAARPPKQISAAPLTSWLNSLHKRNSCQYTSGKMLRRLRLLIGVLALMMLSLMPVPALAASDPGVVRSYTTDADVRQGMLVALKPTDSSKVVPLTIADVTDMFGIAISPNQAPITLSGDAGTQIYVATSGQYNVLVTNQNGVIHAGDYISASALNGIGMKADNSELT